MGWFSADEIVAPAVQTSNAESNHTAQTVAVCVLAGLAVAYAVFRTVTKLHRQHTERVAERAARNVVNMAALQNA